MMGPANLLREEKGYYPNLIRGLEDNEWECFYGLIRMYPDLFYYLEHQLTPRLQKTDTNW